MSEDRVQAGVPWAAISEKKDELFAAIVEAQGKSEGVAKEAQGYKYKYERLEDVLRVNKPILRECGLAILPGNQVIVDGKVRQFRVVVHTSGQFIAFCSEYGATQASLGPQGIGGIKSYDRRYQAKGILNIVGANEDDDARRVQMMDERLREEAKREMKAQREMGEATEFRTRMLSFFEGLVNESPDGAAMSIKEWLFTNHDGQKNKTHVGEYLKRLASNGLLADEDTKREYALALQVRENVLNLFTDEPLRGGTAWKQAFIHCSKLDGDTTVK